MTPSRDPAVHSRLLARGRAMRTVAQYRPGAASQQASPFEAELARARLEQFLTRHGLTLADLDQDPRFHSSYGSGGDWSTPKEPYVPHVIHRMDGFSQTAGKSGGKWRAWCRCGFGVTPRVTRDRAFTALHTKHPLEPPMCYLCGRDFTSAGWMNARDGLRVLVDPFNGDEFMCCSDGCGLYRPSGRRSDGRAKTSARPPGTVMTVAEFVPVLLRERFPAKLSAAVLDDEVGISVLVEMCEGIDGGDAASISVWFRELADRFAQHPSEVAEILRSDVPAAAFAAKLRAHCTSYGTDLTTR